MSTYGGDRRQFRVDDQLKSVTELAQVGTRARRRYRWTLCSGFAFFGPNNFFRRWKVARRLEPVAVPLDEALGRVLIEDIGALDSLPLYHLDPRFRGSC
ncbi:hypothetical protein Nepgr_014055 [Nepenthes gracilis]|uniref:Uncharacterized protein n=1 Tax=Nepenthes gracilis TaxID=150966 RepID=A0AAD3SK66_NEPGR|nr:hypothetical protein Nepgr_014055 [Nepenthes gracilis]